MRISSPSPPRSVSSAACAIEPVVAGKAAEHVGASIADQLIVEGTASQVLDRHQRVGAGAARVLGAGNGEADRHARSRRRIGRGVDARPAVERVVAVAAIEEVLAGQAGQGVVAAEPRESRSRSTCRSACCRRRRR